MTRSIAVALLFLVTCLPVSGAYLRGKQPLKNRYIVTLRDNAVPALKVDAEARRLTKMFGGRLLGTMSSGLRGFGVVLSERRAVALSKIPIVELVEEDEPISLADESVDGGMPGIRGHRQIEW